MIENTIFFKVEANWYFPLTGHVVTNERCNQSTNKFIVSKLENWTRWCFASITLCAIWLQNLSEKNSCNLRCNTLFPTINKIFFHLTRCFKNLCLKNLFLKTWNTLQYSFSNCWKEQTCMGNQACTHQFPHQDCQIGSNSLHTVFQVVIQRHSVFSDLNDLLTQVWNIFNILFWNISAHRYFCSCFHFLFYLFRKYRWQITFCSIWFKTCIYWINDISMYYVT